ncbi:MAG: polysaccharide deacetylase family protein [Betaproteobacteria bacterium]|nr:polysaccharide deacetylase family protein [Betaproteobacteria bacterium]
MQIPILMYHQIDQPPPSGTPLRGMVVSPGAFARQMKLIKLLGYKGLSMPELMPYLKGQKEGKVVGITFDDGYRNNLKHALPILKAAGFSATVYAVSNAIGRTNSWDAPLGIEMKRLMSEAELRTWIKAGMDVGAHSRDHIDLTRCHADAVRDQIVGCRKDLEDALDAAVLHFCYPYGRYTSAHKRIVRAAGYQSATTVQRGRAGTGDSMYALPRVLVAQSTNLLHMLLKLKTRYEDRHR